jgi:hypothetical protein
MTKPKTVEELQEEIDRAESRIKELETHEEPNGNGKAMELRGHQPMILDIGKSLPMAKAQFEAVSKFVTSVLQRSEPADKAKKIAAKDGDYGTIPGVEKPFLFKSGAEKIAALFGYAPIYRTIEKIEDWNDAAPMFFYRYECELRSKTSGNVMGSGIGSCNSKETKYRWRTPQRECPTCHRATIIKGKAEWGGGWICHEKRGGCGERFEDDHNFIVNQSVERIENPDICDLVNTIDKMAQKRALVAAVLIATGSSSLFTQDDDVVDVETMRAKHAKNADITIEPNGNAAPVATSEPRANEKDGWIHLPRNPKNAPLYDKFKRTKNKDFRSQGLPYKWVEGPTYDDDEGRKTTEWQLWTKLPEGVTKGMPTAAPSAPAHAGPPVAATPLDVNAEIMAHFHRLKWTPGRLRAAVDLLDKGAHGDFAALSIDLKNRLLDTMAQEKA